MKSIFLVLIIFIAGIFTSCSTEKYFTPKKNISATYSNIFPQIVESKDVESILGSIRRVNSISFYKRYDFKYGVITKKGIDKKYLEERAIKISNINRTSSGTSTIISITGNNVLLLTAAHIISYPDTLIIYFKKNNGKKTKYIASIAFKLRQQIYANLPDGGRLRIIAKDEKADIAVVGNKFNDITPLSLHKLNLNFGSADELKWGTIIYIFGFPVGKKMVTSGIVSSPNSSKEEGFYVDAIINNGSSGALVFAKRNAASNLEVVGLVSSVPAVKNFVLEPFNSDKKNNFVSGEVYNGKMVIKRLDTIKYGIGRIVPVKTIKKFLENNIDKINRNGFDINSGL